MITSDLVRVRTRKGLVEPRWVDPFEPGLLGLARRLIGLFERGEGRSRDEVDEACEPLVHSHPDPVLVRGLIKLLCDRSEFEVDSPVGPRQVRATVFEMAARVHPVSSGAQLELPADSDRPLRAEVEAGALPDGRPLPPHAPTTRAAVLARVGATLGMEPSAVLAALYADLPGAQVLRRFETLPPQELLSRYNTSLAQAVLLKASRLTATISGNTPGLNRQLLRAIKFHQLLYVLEGRGPERFHLSLDGPLSMFQASSRYGLKLALFLPFLLRSAQFELEAELLWGPRREPRLFRLDRAQGLSTWAPDLGNYRTREEEWFIERWAALSTPWRLDLEPQPLPLGGQRLVIPDFALHHPDGRVAYLEVLGFWRKGALPTRLAQQRDAGLPNLILAVSKNLQASAEALGEVPDGVLYFREIIPPREVVALAERLGRAPS